jgi:hypothetical protein
MNRPNFVPTHRDDVGLTTLCVYNAVDNGTIATLELGSGNKFYGKFQNIITTSFSESFEDISKIQTNFSEAWNIFLFGASPRMIELTGHFIDTQYNPHYQQFMVAYDKYLSGSKCVDNNMETVLFIDGRAIQAILLAVHIRYTGIEQSLKSFSIRAIVKRDIWVRENYSSSGNPDKNSLYNEYFDAPAVLEESDEEASPANIEEPVEEVAV